MKVYDSSPKRGRIWSIEISSRVGRRSIARIISRIPGVRVTQEPGMLSWLPDKPFCRFELRGRRFTIEASWPAGHRFEISPDPAGCSDELLIVREALLAHPAGGA
jgi:hypothetical protein